MGVQINATTMQARALVTVVDNLTRQCVATAAAGERNIAMIVEYDAENPPGREHHWTFVVANPEEKYVDFKSNPEQIPLVLD